MIWNPYPVREQLRITQMYSFFEKSYAKGYSFPGELHDFWECLYVLKGKISVTADERIHSLQEGDIIFHKPMELHKFSVGQETGADLLIFSFTFEGEASDRLKNRVFRLSAEQKEVIYRLTAYIHKTVKADPTSSKTPKYLEYIEPFAHQPAYSQTVTLYLCELFLMLADDGVPSEGSHTQGADLFRKCVGYMTDRLANQITLTELAEYCNISESGVKRLFRKYTGMGVHKYFLTLKIKTASLLLREGVRVSEVAERTGFNSQAYFSAAFKRETGLCASALLPQAGDKKQQT